MVYEDFQADYTEDDPELDITLATVRSTWATMDRKTGGAKVEKDFGAGYFTDFVHTFDVVLTDIEAGDATTRDCLMIYKLQKDDNELWREELLWITVRQITGTDDEYIITCGQHLNGGNVWNDSSGNLTIAGNPDIYFRVERSGTTITVDIYSTSILRDAGSGSDGDIDTFTDGGNGRNDAYQYCIVTMGFNSNQDPNDHSSGYLENLDLNIVAPTYSPSGGSIIPLMEIGGMLQVPLKRRFPKLKPTLKIPKFKSILRFPKLIPRVI